MRRTINNLKNACSDEEGNFRATELIAGMSFAALIPTLWLFMYMLGAR